MEAEPRYALETFLVGNGTKEHMHACMAVQRSKAERRYTGESVSVRELAVKSSRDFCGQCLFEVRVGFALHLLDLYAEHHPDHRLEECWSGETDPTATDEPYKEETR